MNKEIWKKSVRATFNARREPYWMKLGKGKHLGIRKGVNGDLTWIAKFYDRTQGRSILALGDVTDDFEFEHAKKTAEDWFDTCKQGVRMDPNYTVRQAALDYIEDRRAAKSEELAIELEKRFKHYLYQHPLAKMAVTDVMAVDLQNFRNQMIGKKSTKNRKLQFVRAALRCAVHMRRASSIRMGEWTLCKKFKIEDGRRDIYLDIDQRRKLFEFLIPEIKIIARVAATTGARPGEIWRARRKQFDTRTGIMTFIGKTGTRKVKLSPFARDLFTEAAQSKLPDAWLFPNPQGGVWKSNNVAYYVRRAVKHAELQKGTCLYNFRHMFITDQIVDGGWDVLTVANYVGTSLEMIRKHYGHLRDDLDEKLARVQMI